MAPSSETFESVVSELQDLLIQLNLEEENIVVASEEDEWNADHYPAGHEFVIPEFEHQEYFIDWDFVNRFE